MNKPMEPIVRRKLSDEVFDRLENMITSGELTPGDEMPSERVLMERFGVGRPAIREAMQSLAKMGLVSISHGERAKVLKLTARSILQQVDPTAKIMLAQSMDTLEHLKSARIFLNAASHAKRHSRQVTRMLRSFAPSSNASGIRWVMPMHSFQPIWSFISVSRRFQAILSLSR